MIYLLYLIVFAFVIFALFKLVENPVWGLMLIYIVNPFETFFPNLGGLTVGRIVGILTMLIWVLHLSRNAKAWKQLKNSRLLKNQLPFHLAAFISAIVWVTAPEGLNSISGAITFLLLGILALMVENLIDNPQKLRLVATGMAIAGVTACIPAFLYIFGIDLYSFFGAEPPSDLNEETLRATSIGGSPNALGIIARNGIFACLILLSINKTKISNLLLWSSIFICFASIVLAGSRTNFYGTIIVFLVMGYFGASSFFKKTSQVLLTLIGVLVVGFSAFQLTPEPVKQRLLFGGGDDRIAERASSRAGFTEYQQNQSIEFFIDHPFVGVGLDRTYIESGWVAGSHDTVSVVLGEMGFLGFISFLWIMLWSMYTIWQKIRNTQSVKVKTQLSLLLGTLLSMIVMGYAGGFIIPYDRSFWMVLGLIYPFSVVMRQLEPKAHFKTQAHTIGFQKPDNRYRITQTSANEPA